MTDAPEAVPTESAASAEAVPGEWPEAPFDPAVPQPGMQAGSVKVRANVNVLGLDYGQVAMVYDHPEVDALIAEGLLERVE